MQWFTVARELRLLHVTTSPSLRLAALEHIAAAEHHGDNHAPFFVLETPQTEDDDGWTGRSEEVRADWEELRTLLAMDNPGIVLSGMGAALRGQVALARFGVDVSEALRRLKQPLEGLVLVLAPVWVRESRQWAQDIQLLLARPELARVRWIVVEADGPHLAPLVQSLGTQADSVDVRVNDTAVAKNMTQILAAMATVPTVATGFQAVGAAGPRVAPPPRHNDRQPVDRSAQKGPLPPDPSPAPMGDAASSRGNIGGGSGKEPLSMGVPTALMDKDFQKALRLKVFGAAHALREGRTTDAVREQTEARDLCVAAGLIREACTLDVALGGYVMQAGQPQRALQLFREAGTHATNHGLPDVAVQAQLAQGATLLTLQRTDDAAIAYAEAGRLGLEGASPVLAIEGFRMAGQLLAANGRLQEATFAWRRALETAEKASPEEKRSSTAPEAARQLAALCRKHGLKAQAESLERRTG
ncbi:hypothetical protein D7V93_08305 [Corallococcus llansteffanensis]|uniref:Tetratricopeptide repeat protein n=2 Tax=Corallococcus llansteffanensis TaxID=2316731 RepID=A0A3A8Q6M7_9BACT|nr:hypothetical protein D7V93_08305 [Corallococcus llansteffanensis]